MSVKKAIVFLIRADIAAEDKYGNAVQIDDELEKLANLKLQQNIKEAIEFNLKVRIKERDVYVKLEDFRIVKPKLK